MRWKVVPSPNSSSREVARLWRSSDFGVIMIKRLADVALQLAAQDVEIIGRRGAVGHLHVVFGAHLQEALKPGRGMLRPLALIAMRQQADEARHAQPFALAGGNELVEHHLRAIGEIAELRFPEGERVGLGQRIAIFEAKHRLFREHGVDRLDLDLLVLDADG